MDAGTVLPTVVGSTVLMVGCWTLGRWDYSIFWIGILIILSVLKSKLWRDRQRRIIALQQAAIKEKEVVLAQLKDLPAWVQFPDTERVEWMNKVIFQLWPYIGDYSKKFIKEVVEPQIKAHMPNMLKSFRFQEIDIGDIPLRVSGIKVYTENVGRDRIIMDMDVVYAGDCEFVVAVGAFKGGLRQMQFKGKLRAILTPLIPRPPMVGGVSAFFLDLPAVDFDLTGLGEFVELPLLITTVRKVINEQISSICVLPNQIVIPLTTETNVVEMYFGEPDGVIRIHCIEARKLENKDSFLQGKSDPFVRLSVGAQTFRSKTIDNTLEPIWNEVFEAIVDQSSGQKLLIETFDDDLGQSDDFLGRFSLEIEYIRDKGYVESWYPLEGVKHGEIHLSAYWLDLSTDLNLLNQNETLTKHVVSTALVLIYIDSASDLPSTKSDFEPSPFLTISLGKDSQKTFPRPKTRNPLFRQKFIFFASNVEQQVLKFEGKDEANNEKSLGDCEIPLRSLLKEQNLQVFQRTFYLMLGPHSSPLVASVRLRFLKPSDRKMSMQNGIHSGPYHDHLKSEIIPLSLSTYGNLLNDPIESLDNNINDNSNATSVYSPDRTSTPEIGGGVGGTLKFRKLNRQNLANLYSSSLGKLYLTLHYQSVREKLVISIKNARNLKAFAKDGCAHPYVNVKLLMNGKVSEKRKTSVFKSTLNPDFAENIEFNLLSSDYASGTLVFDVKDAYQSSWIRETPVLGQLLLDLSKMNIPEPLTSWFDLNTPCYWQDRSPSRKNV